MTLPIEAPKANEVSIQHVACGVNFIDIYQRTGLYPVNLPAILGVEAAGSVVAVGKEVHHLKVGDRVVYASSSPGAYSTERTLDATVVCKLPDHITFEEAAAIHLKGLTVEYLFTRTLKLVAGDTILFHAAAGGVGLIACQWARALGVKLIATASSDEKCHLAEEYGAWKSVNYTKDDFVAKVKEWTNGSGVRAVYDSLGKDTWDRSLNCLQPLGMMVSFGNASGPIPPVDINALAAKGSLFVTRPVLFHYTDTREHCQAMADHLYQMVESGKIRPHIHKKYPLQLGSEAHNELAARKSTGSILLLP